MKTKELIDQEVNYDFDFEMNRSGLAFVEGSNECTGKSCKSGVSKERRKALNAMQRKKEDNEREGILSHKRARSRVLKYLWIPANIKNMWSV